ncbi:hypothetical protein [Pararobbsia silviterrae]|uniref:hypothetical protein n=1 Tax=Pararobbsia silviterrae TaxID=1792498 RepID=UPI0011C42688|nr:hypothetical protein [Pararobbsia silviterrae]
MSYDPASTSDAPPPYIPPTPPPSYISLERTEDIVAQAAVRSELATVLCAVGNDVPRPFGPIDTLEFIPSSDNAHRLARRLLMLFDAARTSTQTFQAFYEPEFRRGIERWPACANALDTHGNRNLPASLSTQFEAFRAPAEYGKYLRTARNAASSLASMAILTGIALAILHDADSESTSPLDIFKRANLPYGTPGASWGMTGLEVSKAIVTTALSYGTMPPHHMIDEYLKRYENTMHVLMASLTDFDAGLARVLADASRPSLGHRMTNVGSAFGRHLSTVFTLINYLVAPVRLTMFTVEQTAPEEQIADRDTLKSVTGLLRVVSSVSDTLRALLSELGTRCRHAHFGYRMHRLAAQAALVEHVLERIAVSPGHATRVEHMLEQLTTLCTISDDGVLERAAQSRAMRRVIADLLEAPATSETRHFAPSALKSFGVEIGVAHETEQSQMPHASPAGHPSRYRLQTRTPEDRWGRAPDGSLRLMSWLRIAYRVSLTLQAFSARIVDRMTRRWKSHTPA